MLLHIVLLVQIVGGDRKAACSLALNKNLEELIYEQKEMIFACVCLSQLQLIRLIYSPPNAIESAEEYRALKSTKESLRTR